MLKVISGLMTCIHGKRLWCWMKFIDKNHLSPAQRMRLRKVDSIRSHRLCPKMTNFILCLLLNLLMCVYLRDLRSASLFLLEEDFEIQVRFVHVKYFLTNTSSWSLSGLILWLKCIKNRFCKLYLFIMKKLYIKTAVIILSGPPEIATSMLSLGQIWSFRVFWISFFSWNWSVCCLILPLMTGIFMICKIW